MSASSGEPAGVSVPLTEEALEGGGVNRVMRVGDTVRRPAQPWTPAVHALLGHLRDEGFQGAPAALGLDDKGREILEFVPGLVGNYPIAAELRSATALHSSARLLRAFHDATAGAHVLTSGGWQLPPLEPVEVVCHSDFAPYNCVFRDGAAVAIIDFDFARPGPRAWDLAYALYRFAPLAALTNPDTFGDVAIQVDRASQFLDAYGADRALRALTVDMIVPRLHDLVDFMRTAAEQGEEAFARHIAEGHVALYLGDIAHVESHRTALERIIVDN